MTLADGRPVTVTSGYDNTMRIWDPATGQPTCEPLTARRMGVRSEPRPW